MKMENTEKNKLHLIRHPDFGNITDVTYKATLSAMQSVACQQGTLTLRAPGPASVFLETVVIPVYNAELWLDDCLQSVYDQVFHKAIEVSIYNDGSNDKSMQVIGKWKEKLRVKNIDVKITENSSGSPRGVGYAKNRAIEACTGKYLCFLDADDKMNKDRVTKQYQAAVSTPDSIIGSGYHREPAGSTERYTKWANRLTQDQLYTQVYTSHGPTLIMPTWFCNKQVFNKVGGFDEGGKGVPEDLIFFYKHLELGGGLLRVEDDLLMYRYHPHAASFSVKEESIWKLRVEFLQKQVLTKWKGFTIWNAGKQGRKLLRSLSKCNQDKVKMFCDVDEKKISKGYYTYEESKEIPKPKIPIVHFQKALPPFIICVKMDLTSGDFEKNLSSLNLKEGQHYYHFN